jgi:hypothetical protein
MSIFINPADTFDITFVTAESKDKQNEYCDVDETTLRDINEDLDESTIQHHSCTFRYPNFVESASFNDSAIEYVGGKMKFNPAKAEQIRVANLLKAWSFKDKEGNPVPPNQQNIDSLDPSIGRVITYLVNARL